MTFTGAICWLLFIVLGLPMLVGSIGMYLQRQNEEDREALRDVEYCFMTFEKMPWFVRIRLQGSRRKLLDMGFRELVTISRRNLKGLNYSTVMASPDGTVLAPLEYVLFSPLMGLLSAIIMPHRIHHSIFGIAGFSMTSVFPELRRVYTTKARFLGLGQKEGFKEFHFVPGSMGLPQMLQQHREEALKFGGRFNMSPRIFQGQDDYMAFDREAMAKLATEVEQQAAELAKS